jgi:hypothetical protein
MKKITEAELSNRVSSLREKLILEAAPDAGKLNPDAKCTMCGNAYKNHFNFEPAGDPTGKVTSTKFRHPASPTDDFFPGLHETPADPVSGQTPEQAMQDPRYKTDPAFKAEVDAAAAIGTPPAAVTTPVPDPAPAVVTQLQPLAPAVDSSAKVSTPATVKVDPRDGPTGQALARMGISKQNRLDQAFVDRMLGPGYTAGSAKSNLALLKTKPAGDTFAVPKQFDKAPASTSQYQYQTYPPKDVPPEDRARLGLKETVSYADDQTLARIVSLSRR